MPGPKTNNNRKYPDADRQPRHIAHLRAADLKARQDAYDLLTLEQKLAKLPPEPLCKKQRSKLLAKIEKCDRKVVAVVKVPEAPKAELSTEQKKQEKQEKQVRKYMKNV